MPISGIDNLNSYHYDVALPSMPTAHSPSCAHHAHFPLLWNSSHRPDRQEAWPTLFLPRPAPAREFCLAAHRKARCALLSIDQPGRPQPDSRSAGLWQLSSQAQAAKSTGSSVWSAFQQLRRLAAAKRPGCRSPKAMPVDHPIGFHCGQPSSTMS